MNARVLRARAVVSSGTHEQAMDMAGLSESRIT